MRPIWVGALAVVAGVAMAPEPTRACGMFPFVMSPDDDATVPTTARMWIGRDFRCEAGRYQLETAEGEPLAFETVKLAGTCVVQPLAPLPPDTEIRLRGTFASVRFRTSSSARPSAEAPPRIAAITLDCPGGRCSLSFDTRSPRGASADVYLFEDGRILERSYDYGTLEALRQRGRTCFSARDLLSTGVLSPPSAPACVDLGELARRYDAHQATQQRAAGD